MQDQSINQNPNIIEAPPKKSYCRSHKAVFIIYEMILMRYGSEVAPHISKPHIYDEIAEHTFKESPTVGMIINSMLKAGYKTDHNDPDIIRIKEVLKGRNAFANQI